MTPGVARVRIAWRAVDGVLLLDKPPGMSSNDALQKARRLFRAAKGGHGGTLDPLATGLLPLCFGEATKFLHGLLDADKTYHATLRLGQRTETGDAEGRLLAERPVAVDRASLDHALDRFVGAIDQVPPMYSALKRNGRPLYELARQGIEVERPARRITIHGIDVLDYSPPLVRLAVHCSKGTYIRTLAEDIGETLGCGAHLVALRRVAVGELDLERAVSLESIAEAVARGGEGSLLAPVDTLLLGLPAVQLDAATQLRFTRGNPVAVPLSVGERFRVYSPDERFLGLGIRGESGDLQPARLLRSELPESSAVESASEPASMSS